MGKLEFEKVILVADGIYLFVKDYMDALHIAFGSISDCNYFVSCDDEIIQKAHLIEKYLMSNNYKIKICSPEGLIEALK